MEALAGPGPPSIHQSTIHHSMTPSLQRFQHFDIPVSNLLEDFGGFGPETTFGVLAR
jgi:hypothetical protein